MDKKEKIRIYISICVCLFFLGLFFLTAGVKETSPPLLQKPIPEKTLSPNPLTPKTPAQNIGIETTLEINDLKYTKNQKTSTTVYDFMKQLQNDGKITFQERTYAGMGKLIYELNGVKNNGSQNWIYYVNGGKAVVGVSNYQIKPGDVVSWKFEEDIN